MSKLKNYCLNITDGEHGSIIDDPNGEYYFLNNNNITDDGIVINPTDRRMSKKEFERINKRTQLSTNDVVIATCGTLGKTQVITDKNINYDFSRSVGIIKTDTKKLLPLFLHYYFKNPHTQERIEKIAEGAVQKHFYIGAMEDFEVEIPDIGIQKDIISAISSIDEKISNNNVICSDLESMAKLLYDYWFVQFDFPVENGKPYKSSGGKMVWNEELKRDIPDGWEVKHLNEISELITKGTTPSTIGGEFVEKSSVAFIKVESIDNGHINNNLSFISEITQELMKRSQLMKDDILVTIAGRLGAVCVVPDYILPANTNQAVGIVRLKDKSIAYFIKMSMMSEETQHYYKYANAQSIQKNLNLPNVGDTSIVCDKEMKIVKHYCKTIDKICQKIDQCMIENQELASLRDFLLPMLMNGQVKVKKGENK